MSERDFLNGKNLRIATVEIAPFVKLLNDEYGRVTGGTGFCFEILNALMESYNFSISIEVPNDKAYGALLQNGTWNGMIAMILNNETDVAIGSFTMTDVRYHAIDYTVAYFEESSAILIPAAKQEYQSSVFAKPFQLQVWLILIIILGFLPLFMWAESKVVGKTNLPKIRSNKRRLLFFYGVLLTQSGQRIPDKEHSLRLLAVVWLLSSVVFVHAYVGTLMSFLSVPRLKPILRSLDELPSSGLGWFIWRGSDLESFFLGASEGVNREIGDGLRKYPERITDFVNDAELAVINGSFVYMNSLGAIAFAAQQDFQNAGRKCRLTVAKETFYKAHQAFVLPKGSRVGALLNKKMLMMVETGLIEYWQEKYFSFKDYCSESSVNKAVSRNLTLGDVKSAFVIWLTGVSFSFIAFIVENVIFLVRR